MFERPTIHGLRSARPPDENHGLADPLGDLLLSVAAIFVFAIILMLPLGAQPPRRAGEPERMAEAALRGESAAKQLEQRWQNREPVTLLAGKPGLRYGAGPSDTIAVDRILDDEGLSNRLRDAGKADRAILLLIEPDGLESAFLFEAAARHLIGGRLVQIRLSRRCDALRSVSLKRRCGFEAKDVRD